MNATRFMLAALIAVFIAGCGTTIKGRHLYTPLESMPPPPPVIRQPVLPELLKPCRGHVLVPALGMIFVPRGGDPPATGAFVREESVSAPYRIIPPHARLSPEQDPVRLNVELDNYGRVVGLYCG
ncbi:MAG: hypothetical protein EPO08_19640 [Rhodospirillaceae bacterium]|nr:MAG: hypothetical protein EPO08_19640 [Rhodospirillaceae bacterium]